MAFASLDIVFCTRRDAFFGLARFFAALADLERFVAALGDMERFVAALGDMVFSFPRRSMAARASWTWLLSS
jgi:hypothetical protein